MFTGTIYKQMQHLNESSQIERIFVLGEYSINKKYLAHVLQPLLEPEWLANIDKFYDIEKDVQRLNLFRKFDITLAKRSNGKGDYLILFRGKEARPFGFNIATLSNDYNPELGLSLHALAHNLIHGNGESVTISGSTFCSGSNQIGIFARKPFFLNDKLSILKGSIQRNVKYIGPHSHSERSNQFSVGVDMRDHHFSYDVSVRNLKPNPKSRITPELAKSSGISLKSSIKHTYTRDLRRNPRVPRSGTFLKLSQELAGLCGDVRYFKQETCLQFHKDLGNEFSANFGTILGNLFPFGGYCSRINDRYFLGTYTSPFRGYSLFSVGPREDTENIGGETYFSTHMHLMRPLPNFDFIFLHGFVSSGNLIMHDRSQSCIGNLKNLLVQPHFSYGMGLVMSFLEFRVELNWVKNYVSNLWGLQICISSQF
eukprot:TRINITY_DN12254_c0_g1_i1.p1 TRINITY_DN12254_c0_g1~~TRINITY_DN12254_c0_g1_i1.p1  ORF type:complete len:426 (-),score=23.29 TRINITY_DN12254_c0_g1_i1:39-1316(-)